LYAHRELRVTGYAPPSLFEAISHVPLILVRFHRKLQEKTFPNMKPETEKTQALTIAYEAVMRIGYSHKRLIRENLGVNDRTLSRIHSGKAGKPSTDRFYLRLFVTLLKREYDRLLSEADTAGTRALLRTLSQILYAELEI